MHTHKVLPVIVVVLLGPIVCALGQERSSPPASAGEAEELAAAAPVDPGVPTEPPEAEESESKKVDYFVRPKGFGARNETEPPGYVKPLSQRKLLHLEGVDWLEFGIEQRTRWEYRDDNCRQTDLTHNDEFLSLANIASGLRPASEGSQLDGIRLGWATTV